MSAIYEILTKIRNEYLAVIETIEYGNATDSWDNEAERRAIEDLSLNLATAYRALGGSTELLFDARDEIRRKYAHV